jgi:hypothetical protein
MNGMHIFLCNEYLGSDLMLVNLAREAFRAASWPSFVRTGTLMFELDENARNVKNRSDTGILEKSWRL